jgi:hypothetical protein
LTFSILVLSSCIADQAPRTQTSSLNSSDVVAFSEFAASPSNVRFFLKDKPSDEVKSVIVEVDHLEIKVIGGDQPWIRFAENFGAVDLMKLRDGVKLALEDLFLAEGSRIEQIRFYLKTKGNYIVRNDDTICELQTPSQVQSGLKVISPAQSIEIKTGRSYSFVIDFDVDHSIVLQGNGGCLLKPVLKLERATSIDIAELEQEVVLDNAPSSEEDQVENTVTTDDESHYDFFDPVF